VNALEARVRIEADRHAVFVRIGSGQDAEASRCYLDLGNCSGRAVEISAKGWSVVDSPGVHFERPQGSLPLPLPVPERSIELLRPSVNLVESEFQLLITWMAAAVRPVGPYPVLVVHAEQGSAKSTLAKVVRQLIDPHIASVLSEARSTRDLMISAANVSLLVYDNISSLPSWLSDSLCRLATGVGFATRALYSNKEESVIYAQQPVVLNGIDEFVRKADLADRGVFLHPPTIHDFQRREEREFWWSFRDNQGRILGTLLDVIVGALREFPSVRLASLPRMADFARFGEAAGRGLGWPDGTFLSAYLNNRREATASKLEESPLATVLLQQLEQHREFDWTMPPAEALYCFTKWVEKKVAASPRWPKTPTALGKELRWLAPLLREHGLFVTFGKNRQGRLMTFTTKARSDNSSATP
jgi:hypothetical protein